MPQVNQKYLEIKDIENSLCDLIKKENILKPNIKVISGNIQGDGYMGIVNVIELVDIDPNSEKKSFNLVIKIATNSIKVRKDMPIRNAFLAEMNVYETIYPEFYKFYYENILNKDDSFIKIPKFYGCDRTELHESLVLENMKPHGYQMWNRMLPMNDDHINLILNNYSKLHSVSFVMKKKDHALYERLTSDMVDIYDYLKKEGKLLFVKAIDSITKYWDGQIDDKALKKLDEFKYVVSDFLSDIKEVKEYVVLVHGDCWNNNLLFKYEDPSCPRTPTDVCLIDFQLTKRTTPVIDLCYFLCTCCSEDALSNLPSYLNYYYASLEKELKKFNYDCNVIYPRDIFDEHCKKFFKFGFLMSTIIIRMMLSEQDETPSYEDASNQNVINVFLYKSSKEDEYMRRMRGIIKALNKFGML